MWSALLLSLVAAEQPIDPFDTIDAWSLNPDGGGGVTFSLETEAVVTPPGALRIRFIPPANGWGNLLRAVTVPPDAVAVTFRLRVVSAEPGAAMHLWFMEADGDGYVARIRFDGKDLDQLERGVWQAVRVPLGALAYQPRGNQQRSFLSINRMLLGSNFQPLEVIVDDLSFELGAPRADAPLPTTAAWAPADGPSGRVALLDEPDLPRTPGCVPIDRLASLLAEAGYGVTRLRAGDLADPTRLTRESFDLLLLDQGPAFPAAAKDALLTYLKSGGAVFSLGGYAFDRLMQWTGEGWVDLDTQRTAAEMDQQQTTEPLRINTRVGKAGDTMGLAPDQIGLFDPSDMFEHVAEAEWGGRRVEGPVEGFVARSMAGLNSPVFPTKYGETETFGQARDRLGRPRGALGVVAHLTTGPFAGAAWGGVGVTNRDLFAADALGAEPLLEMIERLVSGVYVTDLAAEPVCAREGEPVTISCRVVSRGRAPQPARLTVRVAGTVVTDRTLTVTPGEPATETMTYDPTTTRLDLYPVEATLALEDRVVTTVETGLCVWRPEVVARGPRIAWRDNYLTIGGKPVFLTGTNQTGLMWATPRENPLVWDRDFQQMEDYGFVVWRVLHFSPFAEHDGVRPEHNPLLLGRTPPERLIRQTDAIVMLAQKHGVVFFPCAHDWIGTALTDEELEAQRVWCRFWAERYRDVPGLMWDIQNEPSVGWGDPPPPHILALWEQFLSQEYGTVAAARAALGLPEGLLSPAGGDSWDDRITAARERFRTWLLNRWVKANVDGLREGDPDAIITVGYLQDRHSADKVNGTLHLDFANMHSYESPRAFLASLRFIDQRAQGKGLSLGEFGSVASHNARVIGEFGDRADVDRRRFTTQVAQVFGAGGAFAANWFWRDQPDVVFPWGLFRADRTPRPWAADYQAITLLARGIEPVYEPPALYLLLPDRHRLGPRFRDVDAMLARALDTLSGLDAPFAVLNEFALEQIPTGAKALLWPAPYCPTDETFERVRAWVVAGGQLYLSGYFGYDAERRPTRGERLAALGLPSVPPADPFTEMPLGEPQTVAVGAGQVTWLSDPAERGDAARLRRIYAAFLESTGVPRLPVRPDDGEVQVTAVAGRDGSRAVVVANWGAAREIGVGSVTVGLSGDHGGIVLLGADGALRGVLAQGSASANGPVADADAGFMLVAHDGRDVRDSGALVLMPLGANTLRIASRRAWDEPVVAFGLVEGGRWVTYDRQTPKRDGEALELAFGPEHLGLIGLLGDAPALDAMAEDLVATLRLR